jgi:hypothetical protein
MLAEERAVFSSHHTGNTIRTKAAITARILITSVKKKKTQRRILSKHRGEYEAAGHMRADAKPGDARKLAAAL